MNMQRKNDPIKDLIEKSGNNFHYQVVDFLRSRGWFVLVSPYYNDNLTDKPREIDVIAEKQFHVKDRFNGSLGMLNVRLFIECKYININKSIVLWCDKKDKNRAIRRIIQDTPLKHPNENGLIEQHHYLINTNVAKLFSSTPDKPSDVELIYKAINQSLNAMVYYKHAPSILPDNQNEAGQILRMINYPIILFNNFDQIYKVDKAVEDGYSKIDDSFQLEVNYAYLDKDKSSKTEYFLVDVVEFSKFDGFLKILEETDFKIIKKAITWERRISKK